METTELDEPSISRPPSPEMDRVYHDLATALSEAELNADGRHTVVEAILRERLQSAGHSLTAIDWSIYLLCGTGLLLRTILTPNLFRSTQPRVNGPTQGTADVWVLSATEECKQQWQTETFAFSLTHALPRCWQPEGAESAQFAETPSKVTKVSPPLALVMKGGGIKGLAYVGALEILARKYEFNWFVGTSAGAVTALLLGAGYTNSELTEILKRKNFRDFFDAKWYQLPLNLLFHKGLHHADSFTKWMDNLLAKKLGSPVRVTLSKLPKRVTVYASRREKKVVTFDSSRSDDDAAYAARCSMSIPLLFVPQSHQGFSTYDGGIKYNYPVDALLEEQPKPQFIGLYLGAETYEGVERTSVLADLISIVMESSEPDNLEKYRKSTVIIDTRPINTLDFSLTDVEKEFLLQAGRTAALAHLDDQSEEYAKAVKKRDDLKKIVVAARKTERSRRMRRRVCILALLLLIGGFGISRAWSTASAASVNLNTDANLEQSEPTQARESSDKGLLSVVNDTSRHQALHAISEQDANGTQSLRVSNKGESVTIERMILVSPLPLKVAPFRMDGGDTPYEATRFEFVYIDDRLGKISKFPIQLAHNQSIRSWISEKSTICPHPPTNYDGGDAVSGFWGWDSSSRLPVKTAKIATMRLEIQLATGDWVKLSINSQ